MLKTKLTGEALERTGAVNWIQIFSLEVFDDSEFELYSRVISRTANDNRHLCDARQLGSAETSLTGDKFILNTQSPIFLRNFLSRHNKRLEHAIHSDRVGQVLKTRLVELMPRLVRIGTDFFNFYPKYLISVKLRRHK